MIRKFQRIISTIRRILKETSSRTWRAEFTWQGMMWSVASEILDSIEVSAFASQEETSHCMTRPCRSHFTVINMETRGTEIAKGMIQSQENNTWYTVEKVWNQKRAAVIRMITVIPRVDQTVTVSIRTQLLSKCVCLHLLFVGHRGAIRQAKICQRRQTVHFDWSSSSR